MLALSTLLLQLPARAKLDTVRFTWVVTSNNDKQFKFEGMGADFVIDWGDGEKDSLNDTREIINVRHKYKNENSEYTVILLGKYT